MANYQSNYTGEEIDSGIRKALQGPSAYRLNVEISELTNGSTNEEIIAAFGGQDKMQELADASANENFIYIGAYSEGEGASLPVRCLIFTDDSGNFMGADIQISQYNILTTISIGYDDDIGGFVCERQDYEITMLPIS